MNEHTPPLPPELDQLVAADEQAELGSDVEREAIRERVLATLGLAPPTGRGSGSSASGSGGMSIAARSLLAIAIVGGSIGGYYLLRSQPESMPAMRIPAAAPAAELPLPEQPSVVYAVESPALEPPSNDQPVVRTRQHQPASKQTSAKRVESPGSPNAPASEVPDESELIEAAWSALDRDDPEGALAAIGRHQDHYPTGRLAEERDALRVLALAKAGRTDEARERADLFRAEYPRSIHLAAIQAALRGTGGKP